MAFIPFGKFLSGHIGLAAGWAVVLLCNRLPSFLLFRVADRLAGLWSVKKLIFRTQYVAAGLAFGLAASLFVSPDAIIWLVPIYFAINIFRSFLLLLFPAAMQHWGATERDQKKNFSHWQMILNFASLTGVVAGGFFDSPEVLSTAFVVSGIGFLVSAYAWHRVPDEKVFIPASDRMNAPDWAALFLHPIGLMNVLRKFSYGLLNAFFPILILHMLGLDVSGMSYLYLILGVAAVAGARLAQHVNLNHRTTFLVYSLEIVLIVLACFLQLPLFVYALLGVSAILMGVLDVELQREFVQRFKTRLTSASSSFEAIVSLGLMSGYIVYGLFGDLLGVKGFAALVAGAYILSQIAWWSLGSSIRLGNLVRFGVLIAFVLTLFVAAWSSFQLHNAVLTQFKADSREKIQMTAKLFETSLEIGDYFEVQRLSASISQDPEILYFEVIDSVGNSIVALGDDPAESHASTSEMLVVFVEDPRNPSRKLGTIRASPSYEGFRQTLIRNSSVLFVALVVILALLMFGLFIVYRFLSSYFGSLRRRFLSMLRTDGELPRVPASSIEEIREIDSFLEKSFRQLNRLREKEKEHARYEAKVHIAAQVAHDIQSPLFALKQAQSDLAGESQDLRNMIRLSIERIQAIVNDLRKGGDSPKDILGSSDLEKFSPVLLFREIIEEKRAEHGRPSKWQFLLSIEAEAEVLLLKGSRAHFSRAISNLLNNAVEAMPSGGEVLVSLRCSSGRDLVIEVTDSGHGIRADMLSRIFERGFTKGKKMGSGLGLSQVKQTVIGLGGQIRVQSEVGKGSRFELRFPVLTKASASRAPGQDATEA